MRKLSRFVATITVMFFLWSMCSCTTRHEIPIHSAADMQNVSFDSTKMYSVDFSNGQHYNLKGDHLQLKNDLVGIKSEGTEDFKYYQTEQFKKICVVVHSKTKTIAAIVGGALIVVGGIVAGAFVGLARAQK